jgi:hypothetical protein
VNLSIGAQHWLQALGLQEHGLQEPAARPVALEYNQLVENPFGERDCLQIFLASAGPPPIVNCCGALPRIWTRLCEFRRGAAILRSKKSG